MNLRAKLIEAGARGLAELHLQHLPLSTPEWDDMPDIQRNQYLNQAGAMFDAVLDCLAENEREWIAEERQSKANAWSGATIEDVKPITNVFVVRGLLAVLRATPTEEDQSWRRYQGHVSPMPPPTEDFR